MKKTYRVDEVAEEMEVTPRTVERWIKSGEVPSFKVGGATRIDAEEIERLKKEQQ